jgi:translocation and assembly module TamB
VPVISQWLELNGELSWLPQLEWNLNARAEHLNLASLLADWPSNLQVNLKTRARLDYATREWQLQLDQLQANGSLRDLNLELQGDLQAEPNSWRSQGLRLVLGANRLDLKGGLDKSINLDWDLRAPMLGQLDTRLTGNLASKGQLRGPVQLPQVALDLIGDNLGWQDYRLAQIAINIKPGATTALTRIADDNSGLDEAALRAAAYDININGRKLRLPGISFSSFVLKGDGSANRHQLQATIKSPDYGSLELGVAGRYGDEDWTGSLQQASVKLRNVPRWWLVSGKPIHISARDVSIHEQCFTTRTNLTAAIEKNPLSPQVQPEWNPNQSPVDHHWLLKPGLANASPVEKLPPPRLCIQGNWMPDTGMKLNAKLDSVPLRQFYALFKPEVFFAGVMDGSFSFSTPDFRRDTLSARLSLATRNAELRYQFPGGITESYPWENTRLDAQLDQGLFKANASMQWVGYGYLEANSQIDLLAQNINSGKLYARFDNLAPLETLLTAANNVTGDLTVDLGLAGKLQQPEISGAIKVRNGSANLPKLGLDLTQIHLDLTADKSEQINLAGELYSGKDGRLEVAAQLNHLGSPEWQASGSLRGSNFKVINVPQLKININPDVQLQANANTLRFSGEATIPWARASIKTLPASTTRVSSDVIIEDEQQLAMKDAPGFDVYTTIKLVLGDDVIFKGFGLNSELSGEMQLFKDAQRRQLLTNGFVAVKKGTYKAYGQNLTIERGRLIFQGPYENPGLDIRASRTIDDSEKTQAGLEISGTLQRPTARVYSSSTHSDSEAMMMLLTGKPVTQESRAEATLLLGAFSGLGGDTDNISTGVANFFRVDELAINSDKGIDQSELWIGKQLTPKLMVRYVVGLFDQLVSLGMEYQLSERLRVEAESGETQSVDVIYRIEH